MKRRFVSIATAGLASAAVTAGVLLPGAASGTLTQVGQAPGDIIVYGGSTGTTGTTGISGTSSASGTSGTSGATGLTGATTTDYNTAPVPECPNSCIALTETTGFQVKVGSAVSITTIPRSGSIVAWTITLGAPTTTAPAGQESQTTYFDGNYGGPAEAGIAILKPVGVHLNYELMAQSPLVQLEPYFGQTAEFPLVSSIPVKKGEIVALTVPTWAPVLALDDAAGTTYSKYVSWRASRPKVGCTKSTTLSSQTAQRALASVVQYPCLYQKARLAYSALLVTTP